MSVQIDTETVTLTGEQRLYAAMQEFVDPKAYGGDSCAACLIGQVAGALGLDPDGGYFPVQIAARFGVPASTVDSIFGKAAGMQYVNDFEAAMEMAAEELGLAPTGKEEPYRE